MCLLLSVSAQYVLTLPFGDYIAPYECTEPMYLTINNIILQATSPECELMLPTRLLWFLNVTLECIYGSVHVIL